MDEREDRRGGADRDRQGEDHGQREPPRADVLPERNPNVVEDGVHVVLRYSLFVICYFHPPRTPDLAVASDHPPGPVYPNSTGS